MLSISNRFVHLSEQFLDLFGLLIDDFNVLFVFALIVFEVRGVLLLRFIVNLLELEVTFIDFVKLRVEHIHIIF